MTLVLTRISVTALALAALAVALWASRPAQLPEAPPTLLAAAHGKVKLSSSHHGQAVIEAGDMRPGTKASGRLRLHNAGDVPAHVILHRDKLKSSAGIYGGRLGEVLIFKVRNLRARRTLYHGPLADMDGVALSSWPPGRTHRYRFTLRFPNGGTPPSPVGGDNAYQGSRVKVKFRWTATPIR